MSAEQPSTNKAVEVITDIDYIPAVLSSGAGDKDQNTNSNAPPQEVPNEDEDEERPSNDYDDDAVADDAVVADNATSNPTAGVKFCNAITNLNLVLFFVLGVFSDLDVGYVSTPGFQRFIAIDNFNPAPGALCTFGGMLTGVLGATLLLIKLKPEMRIIISTTVQFIGGGFMWVLPTPYNQFVGFFFMYTGMVALQTTLLPLTFYYGPSVTSSYVAGQTVAGLVGTALINIFDAFNGGKTLHMLVLLCFPIICAIAFFGLDRSVLRVTSDDSSTNNNEHDIEQISNGDNNKTKQEDEEKKNDNGSKSKQLTVSESMAAIMEVKFRYAPFFIIEAIFMGLWNSSFASPTVQSSTFSYAGSTTQETILANSDHVALACALVTTILIVLTIFSPLGKIISNSSPFLLWIPTGTIVIIFIFGSLGVLYDVYPPMPVPVWYFVSILFSISCQSVVAFTPLILGCDTKVTQRYKEFVIQILQTIFLFSQIGAVILSMFWLQQHTREQCQEHYEEQYEGVSCTYFM
mmetsp:Transcript_39979/g.44748  ORF Transcript_39979/g.44748 Transcript_39979/m.44748 type:complete len:519 (+) Transcript_39979:62-1618(+)